MKRFRATLAALVVSASFAFPTFATTPAAGPQDEGVVFDQVAKITEGRGGTWGQAEWSADQNTKKVELRSWHLMGNPPELLCFLSNVPILAMTTVWTSRILNST